MKKTFTNIAHGGLCVRIPGTLRKTLCAHFKGCIHDMTRPVSLLPITQSSHHPLLPSPYPPCTLSHFSTNRKIKAKIDPSEAVLTEACIQNEGSESNCLRFFFSITKYCSKFCSLRQSSFEIMKASDPV